MGEAHRAIRSRAGGRRRSTRTRFSLEKCIQTHARCGRRCGLSCVQHDHARADRARAAHGYCAAVSRTTRTMHRVLTLLAQPNDVSPASPGALPGRPCALPFGDVPPADRSSPEPGRPPRHRPVAALRGCDACRRPVPRRFPGDAEQLATIYTVADLATRLCLQESWQHAQVDRRWTHP
jgi:hypothetical protein